jgi:quercetin dioxygenase-like cupin family protein
MSTCELPTPPAAPAGPLVSRVLRFQPAATAESGHRWLGVPVVEYKEAADHHCGVTRSVLVGNGGEKTAFHVRYFEVQPGGFSTLERHAHEHVVIVLRGQGEVRLGDAVHALGFGDTVYVAPNEVHQLRNVSDAEPFGFLCLVDAERDRPVPMGETKGERGADGCD